MVNLMLTPDAFASRTIDSLTQPEYEALQRAWPAAFGAITDLLVQIDRGLVSEGTSYLDLPLGDLVAEFVA